MPLPNPNYTINFTDPTKTPFVLPAFRTDGPSAPATPTLDVDAAAAHTSLLLYGKGHPNYGQRTDQNLVNMIEHFANSVRPAFPIQGQVWYKNADGTDPSNPADPTLAGLYVFTPRDFAILSASNSTNTFVVAGNQLASFPIGNTFVVTGTVANDGTYNVVSATFSVNTTITVLLVPAVQGAGGTIQASLWNSISISGAPVGDLDMGGFRIINLGAPINPADATNKSYVDAADALHVLKSGDTMSGPLIFTGTAGILITGTGQINMGLNKIINLGAPTLNTDATTKNYVDAQDALKVSKTGDTMTGSLVFSGFAPMDMGGNKITNLGNATAAGDALNLLTGDARYLQLTGGTLTGILTMSGAFISMGGQPIVNMQDPTNPQDAATKAYVDASVGPGSDTYVSSFTYTNGLASSSTINLTQTGPNAGVPFIVNMAHLHSTDDDQYFVQPNTDLDVYYRLFGAPGYQRVTFSAPITNAGIPYTANNTYTATITIDGTPFLISVPVTTFATFTFFDLVTSINSQIGTAGVALVVDGDSWLSVISNTTGSTSTVSLVDTGAFPLFSSITNFTAIAAAVPGFGALLAAGYPTISLTSALSGFDTVKVTTRPVENFAAITVNPRSTPTTPVTGISGPTVSGAAQVVVNVPIITADSGTSEFTIEGGDFTTDIRPGYTFDINDSVIGNNGSYTVLSSSFNNSNNVTTITVVETIPSSTTPGTPDGSITNEFDPTGNFDILTKVWSDTLIARDVQTSTGTASFTFGGGYQEQIFSLTGNEIDITGALATGLANNATVYTAYVFVDHVANPITVTGSAAQTFTTLITQINADLTGATAALVNGRLRITSTSTGAASTIQIADSGTFPLFGSLTNVSFDLMQTSRAEPGLTYLKGFNRLWIYVNGVKQFIDDDYTEDGLYGELQDSVTFTYVVPVAARVEFMSFRA